MDAPKFYVCELCGTMVGKITDYGQIPICCGKPMRELVANTVDAAVEKHLPVVQVDGNTVTATVGALLHPMLDAHYISWIYLQTEQGGQRKTLLPGAAPVAVFALTPEDKPVAAFAYCNLHGLWKTEL